MPADPTPDLSARELHAALRAHRAALAAGTIGTGTHARVTSWNDVLATLAGHGSTLAAVAVLAADDLVSIDLHAQDDWPPAAPVLAADGSWLLTDGPSGALIVWLDPAPRQGTIGAGRP